MIEFTTFLWEEGVYTAHDGGFQEQIVEPSHCDVVIAIFWSRLGTPLPDSFTRRMPDGRAYGSGTAYELLSALETRRQNNHTPDVYVFRKDVIPTVPVNDRIAREEAERQWERLGDFFAEHFETTDRRILRVVERFRELDEFERKVDLALREWIKAHVPLGEVWSVEKKGSPFRGLEPYDARHADIYFGRDRKVLRALDELTEAAKRGKPFLLIPGASGSGKSSLMRAGLAPRIVQPGRISGVDLWRTAIMRPGTDNSPMLSLAKSLFVSGDDADDEGGFGPALPELVNGVFLSPERLALFLSGSAALAADPIIAALSCCADRERMRLQLDREIRPKLLLLIDQMEDLFAPHVTQAERLHFADILTALVDSGYVWVIATLRGDFYEQVITERQFIVLKDMGGQFDLSPPGADELEEIIHRSAAAAGLSYEVRSEQGDGKHTQPVKLDTMLLADSVGENTLPLLQFALDLLFHKSWERDRSKVLRISDYEEIGGIDGAIHQTAELAVAKLIVPEGTSGISAYPITETHIRDLDTKVNPVLESLLRQLVVPVGADSLTDVAVSERALTARVVPIGEARRDEDSMKLIDTLLQARILLVQTSDHGTFVRIAHDRVITSWGRAHELVQKNRAFYRIRDSICHSQVQWEESGRSKEFLIPFGAQITQAEEATRRYQAEFTEPIREFVRLSSNRARFRQRLVSAATLVFAFVAVVATASSYYAAIQRARAIENYGAARGTVGRLVTSIPEKLRNLEGFNVDTVEEALRQADALVSELQKRNADDFELKRIKAAMHYEYARLFQDKESIERALSEANTGMSIRKELVDSKQVSPALLAELAMSYDQVGDIHVSAAGRLMSQRKIGRTEHTRVAGDTDIMDEFSDAYSAFEASYTIRRNLHAEESSNKEWALGVSQSLTRLGDYKAFPLGNQREALGDYEQSLKVILEVFSHDPDDIRWQREISWGLLKVADATSLVNPKESFPRYEQGITVRRYLSHVNANDELLKRDVAWALEKYGRAQRAAGDLVGSEELFMEALWIRRDLLRRDPSNMRWQKELGDTLFAVGDLMFKSDRFGPSAGFFHMCFEVRRQLVRSMGETDSSAVAEREISEEEKRRDAAVAKLSSIPNSRLDEFESLKNEAMTIESSHEERRRMQQTDVKVEWERVKSQLLEEEKM